ncbi:hypothetical protein DPEC_G00320110 [Dallia pectoralis]|uniref:Uncharacterized protein n=1 Tax=Dallia pectoralis TaxID=75939 RepID=A0ACC2F9U2_DALPE|nr:hypothetical protein DPEC_G00320110 [Dallia pectoralis]
MSVHSTAPERSSSATPEAAILARKGKEPCQTRAVKEAIQWPARMSEASQQSRRRGSPRTGRHKDGQREGAGALAKARRWLGTPFRQVQLAATRPSLFPARQGKRTHTFRPKTHTGTVPLWNKHCPGGGG